MGDNRRKRKKTGSPPALRPLFFFFPLTISFSPPLYTLFFFFPTDDLLPPAFLVFFLCLHAQSLLHTSSWLSSAGVDRSTTPSRKKTETVLWAPYCCRAPTQRGSVRTTAFPPPPEPPPLVHTHAHTHPERDTWAEFEGWKGVVRSPVPVPSCFPPRGWGERGGKSCAALYCTGPRSSCTLFSTYNHALYSPPISSVSYALWSSLFSPGWPKDSNGRRQIPFTLGSAF